MGKWAEIRLSIQASMASGPPQDDRIKPLPSAVISQIKSSIAITSLKEVILRLVENSLDAGAKKIDVSVSFPKGSCTIEDDGCGIHPAEFYESGGLGKRYRWSFSGPFSV
jgi:DNA mismatch repair protein MLH3